MYKSKLNKPSLTLKCQFCKGSKFVKICRRLKWMVSYSMNLILGEQTNSPKVRWHQTTISESTGSTVTKSTSKTAGNSTTNTATTSTINTLSETNGTTSTQTTKSRFACTEVKMNQDNNAQSNSEETVVVEETTEAVEAARVNPDGANPDGDSKTAPVLEKQDIETTEKVNYMIF